MSETSNPYPKPRYDQRTTRLTTHIDRDIHDAVLRLRAEGTIPSLAAFVTEALRHSLSSLSAPEHSPVQESATPKPTKQVLRKIGPLPVPQNHIVGNQTEAEGA